MTKFELLVQLDIKIASNMIYEISREFKTPDEIEKQLNNELTEKELQRINTAAQDENYPLSFSFKQ